MENSAGHKSKICAVELNTTDQLKICLDALSSHPLIEVESLCVGPKVDSMDESSLLQLGSKKYNVDLDDKKASFAIEMQNCNVLLLDKVLSR